MAILDKPERAHYGEAYHLYVLKLYAVVLALEFSLDGILKFYRCCLREGAIEDVAGRSVSTSSHIPSGTGELPTE